jgi:hypothetical protein
MCVPACKWLCNPTLIESAPAYDNDDHCMGSASLARVHCPAALCGRGGGSPRAASGEGRRRHSQATPSATDCPHCRPPYGDARKKRTWGCKSSLSCYWSLAMRLISGEQTHATCLCMRLVIYTVQTYTAAEANAIPVCTQTNTVLWLSFVIWGDFIHDLHNVLLPPRSTFSMRRRESFEAMCDFPSCLCLCYFAVHMATIAWEMCSCNRER